MSCIIDHDDGKMNGGCDCLDCNQPLKRLGIMIRSALGPDNDVSETRGSLRTEAASNTKATMHSPVIEEPTLSWVRAQVNTDLSREGRGGGGEQRAGEN